MLIQYIIRLSRIPSGGNVPYMKNGKMRARYIGDEVVVYERGLQEVTFTKNFINKKRHYHILILILNDIGWGTKLAIGVEGGRT